jgi:hypothetical protein
MHMRQTPTLSEEEVLLREHLEEQDWENDATATSRANRHEKGFGVTFTDFIQTLDLAEFEEEVCFVSRLPNRCMYKSRA